MPKPDVAERLLARWGYWVGVLGPNLVAFAVWCYLMARAIRLHPELL
jgi:hypothetical protein